MTKLDSTLHLRGCVINLKQETQPIIFISCIIDQKTLQYIQKANRIVHVHVWGGRLESKWNIVL